ncbi:MAG TPA: hypothetical protein VM164_00745 [Burkholderiales bacterium]|nr:hypothetical protein [Burkholderiales bacterium]
MTEYFKYISPLTFVAIAASAAVLGASAHAASTPAVPLAEELEDSAERARERLDDYLNADHQRGLRARQYDIAPDERKAEQTQLERRLERQRYERLQAQRDLELRRESGSLPPDLLEQRAVLQQQVRSQERQLQYQRFETDRERQQQLLNRGPFLPPLTGTAPPRAP